MKDITDWLFPAASLVGGGLGWLLVQFNLRLSRMDNSLEATKEALADHRVECAAARNKAPPELADMETRLRGDMASIRADVAELRQIAMHIPARMELRT
jgi:hypothetical protein